MIYVSQPTLPNIDDYIEILEGIWDRKWITNNGQVLKDLEKKLCRYLNVDYLTLTTNATLALSISLIGTATEGEVITTPLTFAATTNILLFHGLKPVFADIDLDTYNLDPRDVEKKITKKTTAIMPVHVYGNPCDVKAFEKLAKKYNLKIIYDAAHVFGCRYNGKSLASYGDGSVLSFHAVKLFNTIEGGALVTNSKRLKNKFDLIRNFGIKSETEVVLPGINAKMSEFQAAMGLCNLKNIDENIKKNKKLYKKYKRDLKGKNIGFQKLMTDDYNYIYMPILLETKKLRDRIYNHLYENGYSARKYFYPLTTDFDYFKGQNLTKKYNLVNAKYVSDRVLCLPLYPNLEESHVDKVISLIKEI